jgi:hypothetical protein
MPPSRTRAASAICNMVSAIVTSATEQPVFSIMSSTVCGMPVSTAYTEISLGDCGLYAATNVSSGAEYLQES